MPDVYLTCIQTKKFKSSYWSLRLVTPLDKTTAAMNAVLPRVLRRGTASCPDQEQLAAALDDLYGGVIEPVVTKRGETHCFGFAATFLDDGLVPEGVSQLDKAAHLLGDLLLRPATRNGRLRSDYVNSERMNLINEIKGAINDKRQYAVTRLVETMCAEEPFGIDRLGTLDMAEKINVTRLNQYYHTLLSTARVEVYYCGSASVKRVEQAWREALMDLPRQGGAFEPATHWRIEPTERKDFVERLDVTQGKLAMGFRTGCTLSSLRYPALVVANALFGGTPNSKLFQNVREKLSLCYYASSMLDKHKGLMVVHSGVRFEDFQRAEEEILTQLEAVQRGDFTDEELNAAKKATASSFRTIPDSQGSQEDYWLSQSVSELQISPQELAQMLENVSRDQVIEAASKWKLDTVYYLKGLEGGDES
jgi:predicted Zn-dependent peptidase